MIKMMVVEDEKILREGICRVGDWESIDIEICGKAENGRDALKQIERNVPDLILSDVVMPVMDGIEFARIVYEQYPEIRIIFLSGHEEFEYVKKAMEYKASDYLLKPAKIEEITKVVCRVRDEIEEEKRRRNEEDSLKKKYAQSIPILRNHYMNQLLNGIERDEEKIRKQFKVLDIELSTKNIAILIGESDIKMEDKLSSKIFLLQLNEVCQRVISSEYPCIVFTDLKDRVVTVLNSPDNMHTKDVLLYLQGKARRIQTEMENCWGRSVSLGIGRIGKDISYITKMYKEAEYALAYRFFMGNKSIIYIGDIDKEEHVDWILLEKEESELFGYIKAGDMVGTQKQLEQYFGVLNKYSVCGQLFIYEELISLISAILKNLRGKIQDGEEDFLPELEGLLEKLREKNVHFTLNELKKQVIFVICDVTEKINHNRLLRNEGIIDKAKKYIQQNLSGDVSLIAVAEAVYVSPNYLSCLFKENGENFKDYIMRTKMQMAEEMIESKKYNLNQIALKLGYKDGRYFSMVYKKFKKNDKN